MSITYSPISRSPKKLQEPSNHYHHVNIKALIDLAIESAINVQRHLGLSTSTSTFQQAITYELFIRGLPFIKSTMVPIQYKSQLIKECEFLDIVIDQTLGIYLIDRHLDHEEQLRKVNYFLKNSSLKGLIIFTTNMPLFKKNVLFKIK